MPPNDAPATAEALTPKPNANGGFSHFVDGDIVAAPADVDHYVVDVTGTKISVACSGWRYGSGLRGLKATVLKGDGTAMAGAAQTETETKNVFINAVTIPAGETQLVVKVEAASQDPLVTGTYYRCGIHVNP